jgi:hypothetical protein
VDGRQSDFEAVFGAGGVWKRLLSQSDGYLVTEVWCESQESRQYRVKDFWNWHRDFETFRSRFQREFERFETWIVSEGLIEKQQFLGAYYERRDTGEDGDEDELVPG